MCIEADNELAVPITASVAVSAEVRYIIGRRAGHYIIEIVIYLATLVR